MMSPAVARPLLHTVHLLTFFVLLATGVLLFVPALRAAVVGGYSLHIRQAHRWGGVAFVVLPAVIVLVCGLRRTFMSPGPRTLRAIWQGAHVGITIVMSTVLTLTGFVLWAKRLVPDALHEASLLAHDWLTYVAAGLLAAHLFEIGVAALVTRLAAATARESEPSDEGNGGGAVGR